jgi:hypothetical protein
MYAMPRFSSFIITGIVAGLPAIHSFEFPQGPWSAGQVPLHSAATKAANSDVIEVIRSRKGDRLSVAYAANTEVTESVGPVEFTEGSILYRNHSGRLLFRSDSVTNTLIVLKNVAVPESIVRHTIGLPVQTKNFGIDQSKPASAPLVGCEALASLLADPTLRHLIGRCFS